MYSICFTIAGFVFSILLLVIYHLKSNPKLIENKIYHSMILTTILSSFIEIYSFILVRNNISINSQLYLFSLKLLFIAFLIWLYLFTLYTLVVTIKLKNKDYSNYKRIIIISSIILVISSVITLILPINITEVKGLLLPSGKGVDIIYILASLCFIAMIITIISNRKHLKNKKYYPMYFLIVVLGVMILFQKIFPDLLLINFSISILIYIMYFTIENPDIKVIKELNYTKELLEKQNELVSGVINNLVISIKNPLMEITNFSNKKITKKNANLSLEEIKQFQNQTLDLVDQINKIMDLTRIESRELKIEDRKYQVSNLISSIKEITQNKNIEVNYIIEEDLPKVLYGDDINIAQTFLYLINFIEKYFENYNLTISISKLLVRSKCKLKFEISINYKYSSIEIKERDSRYEITTKCLEYEIYEKLVNLQNGNNFIRKDKDNIIFEFSLFQKIEKVKEEEKEEEITYFDAEGKRVLIALDNHNDIKKMSDMLIGYNVEITTAGSINEFTELLSGNKTYDLIFLSDTITGINNYDIETIESLKRTITKFSLIAGYKLQIIIVTLNNYKNNNIEYLNIPISKLELDDIMIKYLSE